MREAPATPPFDFVKSLMVVYVVLFLAQQIAEKWLSLYGHYTWFGLSGDAVLHGHRIWTLFTYNFLQNTAGFTGGVFVLIFNLLGLYFFGGAVRDQIGTKHFAWLYGGMILAGGLAWCALSFVGVDWLLYGPLATLAGIFALYCCYHANERMTFLAFFIVPVTVKPKFFCWCWITLDLIGFLFYEATGHHSPLWNGHVADLAAMLTAYGYYRIAGRVSLLSGLTGSRIELPRWLRRRRRTRAVTTHFKVNISNRSDLRAEVDRILDKINSEGFGALTDEEKRLLDEARDVLSHR